MNKHGKQILGLLFFITVTYVFYIALMLRICASHAWLSIPIAQGAAITIISVSFVALLLIIVTITLTSIRFSFRNLELQQILGAEIQPGTKVHLIYSKLDLNNTILQASADQLIKQLSAPPNNFKGEELATTLRNIISYPYLHCPRPLASFGETISPAVAIENPASGGDVRATAYAAKLLSNHDISIDVSADADSTVFSKLDCHFICIGRATYKTQDVLHDPANIFIQDEEAFILTGGEKLTDFISSKKDHGIILRIHSKNHPQYSWIVCAGGGEWGTSGAAWYLANRNAVLIKMMHELKIQKYLCSIPDFLAVVSVKPGQDESANLERVYVKKNNKPERLF